MTIRRRTIATLLSIPIVLFAAGCRSQANPYETVTLLVKEHTAECYGLIPRRCLLVRSVENRNWEFFYDTIEGFNYEEGFRYTIVAEKIPVDEPLQDRSAFHYRLIRIEKKVAVR
jgi:hypothetical protein